MVKLILFFFGLATLYSALGQSTSPLRPVRTRENINVDGKLNEAAWKNAEVLRDFIQCFPKIGASPSEYTEARILYDDNFLYIGIMAYDSMPSRIIATGLERDVYYSSDDHVCVILDTYNDKRQGILLATNPLSARFDEEVFDNGNSFNAAYNTFWNVRSLRSEEGYSTEFQIPFSSLRFQQESEVVMAIKLVRYIKNKNEYDIFPASDPGVANAVWRINNCQEVIFTDLKTKKPFYFFPYAKANFQENKIWNSDESQIMKTSEFMHRNNFSSKPALDKLISNIGFDIKYGLSKNFTLDVTVNTDFAQAETDNRILNFTRFDINLPEKRNFFLESKDYLGFSTGSGMLLFNSRTIGIEKGNIVPIIGGMRVSGKSNGFQFGFLDLQTSGIDEFEIDPQHFTVLRLRKEVWGNGSFVGGIITNRISTHGGSFNNQTLGVDAVRRFKDNKWVAGANLGVTNNKNESGYFNPNVMANMVLSRVAALGYNHTTSVEYSDKNFKPLSGFAPDSAYVLANISNGYIWKWKDSPRKNLYWITHLMDYKYRTTNHTHESIYSEVEFGTSFKSGANIVLTSFAGREYLPYDWNFSGDINIPEGYYSYPGMKVRYDSKQTKLLNYSVTGRINGFYGGNRFNFLLNGYYAVNRNFRFTYKYEFNLFKFPESFSSSKNLHYPFNLIAVGLAYTQSIYFSVKALIQYDDISETIGGNFRIRINPKEGTDLFIVYNPRVNMAFSNLEGHNTLVADQQTFIIKFSKALSF
jgi:hypothetical protein